MAHVLNVPLKPGMENLKSQASTKMPQIERSGVRDCVTIHQPTDISGQ